MRRTQGAQAYTHSDKLGLSLLGIPLIGFATAFILEMGYAYVTIYIPSEGYISRLFIFGMALALASASS